MQPRVAARSLLSLVLVLLASACGDTAPPGADGQANQNNGTGPVCGDGQQEGSEECDEGAANSDVAPDACRTDCRAARCGDGTRDASEACDEGPRNAADVPDACRPDCREPTCGDGVVDPAHGETCDLGAANSDAPDAICRTDCHTRGCGDGVLDAGSGEECEPGLPVNATCEDVGYYAGELGCSGACRFDPAGCVGTCGDGEASGPEACDGDDVQGLGCAAFGYHRGDLGCTALCAFDLGGCEGRCGDGVRDDAEVCDGTELGSAACTGFGFYGGDLGCTAGCAHDLGGCTGFCGDGLVNGPEQCDGTPLAADGCGLYGYYEGALGCSAFCRHVVDGCSGRCGDGVVQASHGEQCDGQPPEQVSCLDYDYDFGVLGCASWCRPGLSDCHFMGWQNQATTESTALVAVTGLAEDDAWAVGQDGRIARWDGFVWNEAPSPTRSQLQAVWGTAPDDVWIGGQHDTLLHWDGAAWSVVREGPADMFPIVYGIWGAAPDDVWALGVLHAYPDPGYALHWDGQDWTPVSLPAGSTSVYAVFGRAADEVWAVGTSDALLRWDGSAWTLACKGWDAWSAYVGGFSDGPGRAYAVTGNGGVDHFDGTSCMRVREEPVDGLGNHLRGYGGVIGRSPLEAYAVYSSYVDLTHKVERWNGWAWEDEVVDTDATLYGLGATPLGELLVVGSTGFVAYHAGVSVTRFTGSSGTFWALHGSQGNDVWAVGPYGNLRHFDGSAWTWWNGGGSFTHHRAVWAPTPTDTFVVGDGAWLWYRDAMGFHQADTGTGVYNTAVLALAADDVWVAGRGQVLRWDRATFTAHGAGLAPEDAPTALRGTSATDLWLLGEAGLVARFDGATWTRMLLPDGETALDLWVDGTGAARVVDARGSVFRRDGATWTRLFDGRTATLGGRALALLNASGRGDADLLGVGAAGLVARFDGQRWTPVRAGLTRDLRGIFRLGVETYVSGDIGDLARLRWSRP